MQVYGEVSPFAFAWVAFQRGLMWDEVAGWPETRVIIRFWLLAGFAAALALGIFYADFLSIPGSVD